MRHALVLIVHDDTSLLNANINGVLAIVVSHAISFTSASYLFAAARWHTDQNVNALGGLAAVAWIINGYTDH